MQIEGRTVEWRVWEYEAHSVSDAVGPVCLLDANVPENSESDRTLTHRDAAGSASVMRQAITVTGSFFNTQRMTRQYVLDAYFE